MPFRDRADAGRKLAAALGHYENTHVVVLALPRGGVPVAAIVAAALEAPLDLIFVRKIGLPAQPELAMGAVVDGAGAPVVRNEEVMRRAGIGEADFAAACERELREIERRRKRYLQNRQTVPIEGRIAIVIDDGLATGATMRAALRAVRARKPAKLVLAVPVGPSDTLEAMQDEADELVCLERYDGFDAIGFYYDDFSQVSDEEVVEIHARSRRGPAGTS